MTYHSHPRPELASPDDKEYEHEKDLADFIRMALEMPDTDHISIYSMEHERFGYRIHEISTFCPDPVNGLPYGGGGSWMRSDVDSGNVILRAEQFVIGFDEEIIEHKCVGLGDAEDEWTDFHQEDEQALVYAMTGKFPDWEWEDRRVGQEHGR